MVFGPTKEIRKALKHLQNSGLVFDIDGVPTENIICDETRVPVVGEISSDPTLLVIKEIEKVMVHMKSALFKSRTRNPRPEKTDNSPILKRDLRLSRFSQWISSQDWSPVLHIHDCETKFKKIYDIL